MPSSEDKSPKVKFPAYTCVPGRSGWEEFKLLLVTHGSKANDYGDSLATCILGTNIGGANGAGFPGTTPAQIQYAQRAGRKLHSETLEYLCTHIADSCHRDYIQRNFGVLNLAKPDPHGAYLYLMQECDVPDCREGEDAHDMKWLQFSILKDIGKDEHTVTNAMKELRALNAKRPAHMRKTPDEVTEKLLRMLVGSSSSSVGIEAQKELEAVAGAAGGPGVRQYQNPAAAVGTMRHQGNPGIAATAAPAAASPRTQSAGPPPEVPRCSPTLTTSDLLTTRAHRERDAEAQHGRDVATARRHLGLQHKLPRRDAQGVFGLVGSRQLLRHWRRHCRCHANGNRAL